MSKRRHRRPRRNRLRRNAEGASAGILQQLVIPSLVGAGGLLAAQWLSDNLIGSLLPGQDPRLQTLVTGAGAGAVLLMFGEGLGLPAEIAQAAAIGSGIAGLMPFLPKPVATVAAPPAAPVSGFGSLMVDVSHYGAPYKGMFGLGDERPRDLSATSTVAPTDLAFRVKNVRQVKPVTEMFASPSAERGHAGGIFARQLFSGADG